MTTDIDALVERLGARKPECDGCNGIFEVDRNPDGPAAIEALTRLSEENARLREAGVALALAAGKLNVALDGQERYRLYRQAVLSAMEEFAALGDAQVARHGAHR